MTGFVIGTPQSPFGASGGRFEIDPRPGPAEALRHLERHGSYTHTGYPFMQLAKQTGVDYGDVLLAASWKQNDVRESRSDAVGRLPLYVVTRIERLLDIPVHLRGGDHYVRQDPHDD